MTVQCHCLGFVNRVTWPHCPSAHLQHQPNIILSVSPQNPPKKILSGQHIPPEILWHLLQAVLSPSSSLSYHLWTFSKAYQMALMLTHPHCDVSLISWPWTVKKLFTVRECEGIEDFLYRLQRRLLFQWGITPTGLGHDYRTLHCGLEELFLGSTVLCLTSWNVAAYLLLSLSFLLRVLF